MTDTSARAQLVALLKETGPVHHWAYQATNGADPDWPLWYAEYMLARLNALLGTALTRSELTYLLVRVEMERAVRAPNTAWPDYYADFFEPLRPYGGPDAAGAADVAAPGRLSPRVEIYRRTGCA